MELSFVARSVALHIRDLHTVALVALEEIEIKSWIFIDSIWALIIISPKCLTFLSQDWKRHLVICEEWIVVLIDAKVDDVSPENDDLGLTAMWSWRWKGENHLTWKLRHCFLSSQMSRHVWQPTSWNIKALTSSERMFTLSSKSPDHLAKLLHALVLSCVQETEFCRFWTLRPNASELKLNIFSHRNLFGLKFYFYLCLWIRTHVVFDSGQRLQLQ